MKKTKLSLRRESLQQLTSERLGRVHGGSDDSIEVCTGMCGPPPTSIKDPDGCPSNVSSKARLGINYPC